MASGGTWVDLLATRLRTLETFAPVFRERDSMRRALSRPIFLPETLRAIAEAQEVIAAARAPIAQLQAHLGLPAAAPTHATPPAVPSPPPPPAPPDSSEAVANTIAARIKAGDYESIDALAQEFAPRLVMLGLLRRGSRPETCRRRLQAFCRRHVYDVRIPDGALPAQIRSGRRTGGQRR